MTKDRGRKPPFFCISTNKVAQANDSGEGRGLPFFCLTTNKRVDVNKVAQGDRTTHANKMGHGSYQANKRTNEGGTPLTGLTSLSESALSVRYFFYFTRGGPSLHVTVSVLRWVHTKGVTDV